MKHLFKKSFMGMATAGLLVGGLFYSYAQELFFSPIEPKIIPNYNSGLNVYNKYCNYPIEVKLNSNDFLVSATDVKFFASGFTLTGFQTGTAFSNFLSSNGSSYWPLTGNSTRSQGIYQTGKQYYYINANVGFGVTTGKTISGEILVKLFFKSSADIDNGEMKFYYITGTGDDSNLQSGVVNGFVNVINSVTNTSGFSFTQRPCILDVEAPLFTGYQSGEIVNYFTGALQLTVYDWTGLRDIAHYYYNAITNPTNHYYYNGGSYESVGAIEIDNQMGVNSGCFIGFLSGTVHRGFTGEGIYPGTTLIASGVMQPYDIAPMLSGYAGEGTGRTWTGNDRGYSVDFLWSSDPSVYDNQDVYFQWTGCDFPNQNGEVHTGTLAYTLTLTGFDKFPPYISGAYYTFTTFSGTNASGSDITYVQLTGVGNTFDASTRLNWTSWTSGYVDLVLTGSEEFKILTDTVTGTLSAYIPQTFPQSMDSTYGAARTMTFSGNYEGVTFNFWDNPPYILTGAQFYNTGETYVTGSTRYVYSFNGDVFWIDRTIPSVNYTSDYASGAGTSNLYLTGNATGFAGSENDDEFIIIGYSGTTQPTVIGGWANIIANDSFTSLTQQKLITFTEDRAGCIKVRDIAGNQVCVEVTILLDARNMQINALPAQRVDNNFGFSAQAIFWNTGSHANMSTGNYITRRNVSFSTLGTGLFTGVTLPSSGDNYLIMIKSRGHLSMGYTGADSIRSSTGFDLTTGTYNYQTGYLNLFPGLTVSSSYPGDRFLIVPGDVNDNDIVGATDLSLINEGLTRGFNVINSWDDFDNDGYVTAKDQAILIENSSRIGYWATTKLGGSLVGTPETVGTQDSYPWMLP